MQSLHLYLEENGWLSRLLTTKKVIHCLQPYQREKFVRCSISSGGRRYCTEMGGNTKDTHMLREAKAAALGTMKTDIWKRPSWLGLTRTNATFLPGMCHFHKQSTFPERCHPANVTQVTYTDHTSPYSPGPTHGFTKFQPWSVTLRSTNEQR